jgi:hypothetical protein
MKNLKFSFVAIMLMQITFSQIPKTEYEYRTEGKNCVLIDFGQTQVNQGSPTLDQIPHFPCDTGVPDMNALGKEGWQLVDITEDFQLKNIEPGYMTTQHWVGYFNRIFIFKREKPIDEKHFYSELDKIAKTKIDSAMLELKNFVITTLNQSTKELFATEYAETMKASILAKIRGEIEQTVKDVINETKQ